MLIVLGDRIKSAAAANYTCEGCEDHVRVEIDWYSGYGWEDANKAIQDIGWRRRRFSEEVNPWFCSEKCATESRNALYWEEIWKNK